MLTNECKYGIRAVLFLAQNRNIQKIGSKEIADKLEIPAPFLAKILQKLSRKNLVSSTKGPGGGFFLNENNMGAKLMDVIVCLDGSNVFDHCFLGLTQCNEEKPCCVHHIVSAFRQQLTREFKGKTIAELSSELNELAINKLIQ